MIIIDNNAFENFDNIIMGDDGHEYTDGYMNPGEIPDFKVFDSSSGDLIDMDFYNFYPNLEDYAWQYNPHKGTISDRKWYLSIGIDF